MADAKLCSGILLCCSRLRITANQETHEINYAKLTFLEPQSCGYLIKSQQPNIFCLMSIRYILSTFDSYNHSKKSLCY
jgi:hypothetical protein